MLDWLRGDDDDTADPESAGEDLLGDADWDDGDDLDDDFDMDEFSGDSQDDVAEVTNKVDEFEEEIGSMSSTVNTLEHENAELSEDIEEVKDNVRKLLEIYEMVTRGVNPFADDDPFQTGAESGSFDIFGADDDETDTDGEFDDPDDLLDDDIDEMEDFALDDEFDDDFIEEPPADDEDEELEEPADGRSFDEIKDEYEDADETEEPDLDPVADGPAPEDDLSATTADDSRRQFDDSVYGDGGTGPLGEKPYLRQLPHGYGSDLLIMRWIEELGDADRETPAADTIEYYRAIGWLSDPVADELLAYAPGIDGNVADSRPEPASSLPMEVHKRSLRYIHHLATTTSRQVVLSEPPEAMDDVLEFDTGFAEDLDQIARTAARTDGGRNFWATIAGQGHWRPADLDDPGDR